jgi:F-type H+-transporting ATPase subunit epsilon
VPPLYQLTVLAPEAREYEGTVQSLVAPGIEGYFGVLARHAPMVAELTAGELSMVNERGEPEFFAVAGGYLEVGWDRVVVLADASESADEIDVERARAAEQRARERLRRDERDVDVPRAEAALRRALNRLRVAQRRSRHG